MEKDNKMEKRELTYLCNGKECKFAPYCRCVLTTTTLEEEKVSNIRRHTRWYELDDCINIAKGNKGLFR